MDSEEREEHGTPDEGEWVPPRLPSVPRHVAIIMDGNGRWARQRGLPRTSGHREGTKAVKEVIKAAQQLSIEILTLYTFSTENWSRPRLEVDFLMALLRETFEREIDELKARNVQVRTIGDTSVFQKSLRDVIDLAVSSTSDNTGLIVSFALNYGARDEMVRAARKLVERFSETGEDPEVIDEELFANYLYTDGMADPDLLIRTGGELRVSNFLLWQIAYTEFWCTPRYWPDFGRDDLVEAIRDYGERERRFGRVGER